ncbi:MAG: ATP-binding cassette, subfamily er 3 [Clostridiales bacterium]|nr:ATP-binding cassette, subfamily er 3 [Clostridiales bacterium]
MIELSMNGMSKYFGAELVFQKLSFEIKTGERIGLVGQNGCGKTTLFKVLMGIEEHQEGEISIRKGCKLGYLNQIPVFPKEMTVMEVIQIAFQEVIDVGNKVHALEEAMSVAVEEDTLDALMRKYSHLQQTYEQLGGYDMEVKLSKVCEGLSIAQEQRAMRFEALSGGEKTRVILAKLLVEEPDLLLLDEPTNHLDLDTIAWLEGFLKDYKGTVFVISHDRRFLDRAVEKIVELKRDQMEVYCGNYSYYVKEKERRFQSAMKEYELQKKKIESMERQIERFRIWGAMRDSDKMYKQAKVIEHRLEKMEALERPVKEAKGLRLDPVATERSGRIVLRATDVCKGFLEHSLFTGVNFEIYYQDHVCIMGKNGSGKTTLLKVILGEVEPDRGTTAFGASVKIGYLPQQVVFEREDMTVLEYFARRHDLTYGKARGELAKALFIREEVNKTIGMLSGGEKSRLRLSSLMREGVNFLILDEPTNHLDIASREILEETLLRFEGTILFVSHDRYFVDRIATRILEIGKESGRVF